MVGELLNYRDYQVYLPIPLYPNNALVSTIRSGNFLIQCTKPEYLLWKAYSPGLKGLPVFAQCDFVNLLVGLCKITDHDSNEFSLLTV